MPADHVMTTPVCCVHPCEHCTPPRFCDFAQRGLGPCAGQVRAYMLDPETRLHLCDAHVGYLDETL